MTSKTKKEVSPKARLILNLEKKIRGLRKLEIALARKFTDDSRAIKTRTADALIQLKALKKK